MTPQCNPKNLCVREPKRDKRIRVKPSIFKKNNSKIKIKTLFNKPKLACVAIKDNSIILLEFVFDLILMKSFFLKILLKFFKIKIIFFKNLTLSWTL